MAFVLSAYCRRLAPEARRSQRIFIASVPPPLYKRGLHANTRVGKNSDHWMRSSALFLSVWLVCALPSTTVNAGWWPFRSRASSIFDDPVLRKALEHRRESEKEMGKYVESMRGKFQELMSLKTSKKIDHAEFELRVHALGNEFALETQRITYGIVDPPDARREYETLYGCCRYTPEAIRLIASFSPIVEIGGGRGHWQKALREAGASVISFDSGTSPRPLAALPPVGEVYAGDELMLRAHCGKTLLLVYPPEGDMALRCVHEYEGDLVVYVGEGRGGVNACTEFFDLMESEWVAEVVMDLDPFPQCFERLYVLCRKSMPPKGNFSSLVLSKEKGNT
ncbi:unnamed protein product [Choristocarpus tenellus]